MHFYLVQRGTIRPDESGINGLDALIQWDYMGAAEFEFGALPKALKEICNVFVNLQMHKVPNVAHKDGRLMYILCAPEQKDEIITFIQEAYAGKRHSSLKERTEIDGGVLKDGRIDFWWDLDNCWMACWGEKNISKVDVALHEVKKLKGW